MELTRRSFIIGSAALIGGIALQDATEKIGVLYSFPKEIKLASSFTDSKYFHTVEELQYENLGRSRSFWDVKTIARKPMFIRREIFDAKDFYDPRALPIKVEYKPILTQAGFVI
jgi:hypothetical protein